jgi:methylenetetrahydrofolate--tRNA-(uracil-5-)-methyltransferase
MLELFYMKKLTIIGGGLSGCEAAWQAAERGILVTLYEMRPHHTTGAHQTANLAELVCSNSLGSQLLDRSSGLLINELEMLNSLLIRIAKSCAVPAGHALAIDRHLFSKRITKEITSHPNIQVIRKEIRSIPSSPTIIASGPLTSDSLAKSIKQITNHENLFFFDAIAPIIEFESINMNIAFWGSRYGKGFNKRGDYINCPFDKSTYELFITELVNAERIELRKFEKEIPNGVRAGKGKFFEGCLPIEIMAQRGFNTLAFGPLRPVGLTNPHNGNRSFAIVQLRQDDLEGNFFNIVGFQTNLKYIEQKRVFRLIPGLENAMFERHGQMHRNTFINSPESLNKYLQLDTNPNLFFCGQITGVEGYLANIASGLFAGINSARMLANQEMVAFPPTTMLGALNKHVINRTEKAFQPMKANFGLLPALVDKIKPKRERYQAYSDRAIKDLKFFLKTSGI